MNKKLVLPILLNLALVGHIKASDHTAAKAALTKEDYDSARGTLIEGYEHLTPAEFALVIKQAPVASSASIFSSHHSTFEAQWPEYNKAASRSAKRVSAFTAPGAASKPVTRITPGSIDDVSRLLTVVSPETTYGRASTCVPMTSSDCVSTITTVDPVSTCTISESARLSSTTPGFGGSPARVSAQERLKSVSAFLRTNLK